LLAAPGTVRRSSPLGLADLAVVLGALVALALIAKVGAGTLVSFQPSSTGPHLDLDPRNLPYYAARSTLRMFVALSWSIVFTLAYGYAAARSARLERLLIPLLDILQSYRCSDFSRSRLPVSSRCSRESPRAGNGVDLCYFHVASVEHGFRILPVVAKHSERARRGRRTLSPLGVATLHAARSSRRHDRTGLERHDELGGGWFFLAASEAISS